jgi:RimJ/RimL family protein N-acetyltransferase
MRLIALDREGIALAAAWLGRQENWQWLDFGAAGQALSAPVLAVMNARPLHRLRLFCPDTDSPPIGIVGLSEIHESFGTANLWYVLGDKAYGGHGHTTRAVALMVREGFDVVGLHAVTAWAVDVNVPSIRVLERTGFRRIGRQRECHVLDGRRHDRLLFDRLGSDGSA